MKKNTLIKYFISSILGFSLCISGMNVFAEEPNPEDPGNAGTTTLETSTSESEIETDSTEKLPTETKEFEYSHSINLTALNEITDYYAIKIHWGNMKFQFDRSKLKWNSSTHQYEKLNDTEADRPWVKTDYDGTNNKITVINNSNCKIKVAYKYALESNGLNKTDSTTATKVKAYFSDTNESAIDISKQLNPVAVTCSQGVESGNYILYSSDATSPNYADSSSCNKDLYLSLCGTPDTNLLKRMVKDKEYKVGTITLNITALKSAQSN